MVIDSYWWLLDASFQFLPAKAIFIIQLRLAKKDASWPGWPVQNMSGRFSNRNFGWRHGCQGWAIINAWRNIRDKPLGVADMAQPCAMRHAPAMRQPCAEARRSVSLRSDGCADSFGEGSVCLRDTRRSEKKPIVAQLVRETQTENDVL